MSEGGAMGDGRAEALALAQRVWGADRPAPAVIVPSGPRAWFVLITVSQGEERARQGLIAAGYDVYIPKRVELVRHHRRPNRPLIRREFRLFNRYIFAEVPTDTRQWGAVRAVKELAGALGDGGQPRPIDASLVEDIQRREKRGEFDSGGKGSVPKAYGLKRFPIGSYARATLGPFGGFAGRVESVDGKGAIKVLLEVFGRATPVEFDPDHLEPA